MLTTEDPAALRSRAIRRLVAAMVWSFFLWRLYKWLWQVSFSHDQHCLQLAELDQYAGEIRNDCNELQRTAGKAWWKLRHNR